MKNILIFLFLFLFVIDFSFAQIDNWLRYIAEKKGEFAVGALEFLIPIIGHAYADDASRGVIQAFVNVCGLTLSFVSASEMKLTNVKSHLTTIYLRYLICIGERILFIVLTVQITQDYNNKLKKKLNLSLMPYQNPDGNLSSGINLKYGSLLEKRKSLKYNIIILTCSNKSEESYIIKS